MTSFAMPVENFVAKLTAAGLRRAALVYDHDRDELLCSHATLEPLAAELQADCADFDAHEALFFEVGERSGHLLAAALHRTVRGQGAGGVRFWAYPTLGDFIRDGLRLSHGMGQKSALAGLWWGGGKGLIARRTDCDHRDPAMRRTIYEDYGRFIAGLRGCYVTAEDVGTTPDDMLSIHKTTRYATCVPEALGGSGNPSRVTAEGVVVAMEAAREHLGQGTLAGAHVAMQGLGNVARFMVRALLARGVGRIDAVDIDPELVASVRREIDDKRLVVSSVSPADRAILGASCDILAPNAVGGIIDPGTIATVKAPIVCGAANNQLSDPDRDSDLLARQGTLFVPDFLANRMGIVNCANEQYGWFEGDPAIMVHLDRDHSEGIFARTVDVLENARKNGTTPWSEAVRLADQLAQEPHPIWGERTRDLIRYLFDSGWANAPTP